MNHLEGASSRTQIAHRTSVPYSTLMSYLYLTTAIIAEVLATSFLKQSEGFTRPLPTLMMGVGYVIAFFFLSLALREIPTGIAYAIWSGAGVVLITGIAWILQGQDLDAAALAGIALIVMGVIVISLFSTSVSH